MHGQEEDEGVFRVLVRLDLLKHGLRFLQKNQRFFITFLRDEVDCALVEFVNHDGHLV